MSGGSFHGRSFGPHGAYYNNSRSIGRDDGGGIGGRGGRSRDDNNRNNRNYSRENFDNTSSSRRNEHSQIEVWSNRRTFTRWDQPLNNQQTLPLLSSVHNQSLWPQNPGGNYQNGPIRFQHRNDSQQYYNRGGRGYFSRGNCRFSNPRGSQNFLSPYYTTPFRENAYNQHDKEMPPEKPVIPLLGSEEERQQKITEAADELKRKLLCASVTNDAIHADCLDNDNTILKSPNYKHELNLTKPIAKTKRESLHLNLTINNSRDIDISNEKDIINPIEQIDYNQMNNINELKAVAPACINNQYDCNIDTNLIIMSTANVNINNEANVAIDKQNNEINCTVNISNNSKDQLDSIINKSNDELTTDHLNPEISKTVIDTSVINDESAQAITIDTTFNTVSSAMDTPNIVDVINTDVPDVMITNSTTVEPLLNIVNNNEIDAKISSDNNTQNIPFLTNFNVPPPSEEIESSLIKYLEKQLSENSSSSLSNATDDNKIKNSTEINDKHDINQHIFSSLSNHSQDHNAEYIENSTGIINDYSESSILQPPPLPPILPLTSYESTKLCVNSIVPEFESIIRPSNIPSPCNTFQHSPAFNTHLSSISPIMPTTSVVNPSMNIPASMSGYAMGHQNYVSVPPYVPGVSLAYPPVILPLDYVQAQSVPPALLPPLPQSSPIQPLILQDIYATNTNDDEDMLDELKKAMEFAKQVMGMGNDNDKTDEENIEFQTFPDLPPVMPPEAPPKKSNEHKKISKTKKLKQEVFGPLMNDNIDTITQTIRLPDETSADDPNRRKVVFNLNSKFKKLNKKDDVWVDEPLEENKKIRQRKIQALSPVCPVEKYKNSEKSREDRRIEKIKVSDKVNKCEKIKEPEDNKKSTKSPKSDNKNEKNNHRKIVESNRESNKDRYEVKKKIDKQSDLSLINNTMKKKQYLQTIRVRKPEETCDDDIIVMSEKSSRTKAQPSISNKSAIKTTISKSLKESSWKDRVIGRFLKMSKNDIQNMINNSSLRKFDIAMKHLVKEKKSSLSLEMRNHEDEKMKTKIYDSEDFMSQLQAILDPAATVDITNLPTNFIHQLSEVLHLDSLPGADVSNNLNNKKPAEFILPFTQEPSTSTKIDPKVTNESSRYGGKNTPVISTHDLSKSRKIDNRVCKDTVKNTPSTVLEVTTCARTKMKRGRVDNTNIECKTNQVTPLSASSKNGNKIIMNQHDNVTQAGVSRTKIIKASSNNNAKGAINKIPTGVNERLSSMNTTATTSVTLPRIETPIVTRVARQAVELDKLFVAGISKAKAACLSTKPNAVDLTIGEGHHDAREHKSSHRGMIRDEMAECLWRRKGIDNADIFRNMTKEEYEILYSESLHDDEYKKIVSSRSRNITANGREIACHSSHSDKSTSRGSHSPPRVPIQNLVNQTESGASDSQYDSDTSNSSNSSSSSEVEPSLIEVTKVLKFIKEREKMAKKKTINEEIRDEVAAEIEKRRKEKNAKHKSHKSRSKKRDKRKKDKRIKKKKVKKKRRRKTHHLPHTSEIVIQQDELPLRLLNENEIKREPISSPPSQIISEISKTTVQCSRSTPATKISTTSTSINNSTDETAINCQMPSTNIHTSIIPSITSTPILTTSKFQGNPMLNSPSLIITVNTNAVNENAPSSSAVKATLTSTVTSPMRSVTAVSLPGTTAPQSPIFQPKTKAQLKQMPEAIKTAQNNDSKLVESKIVEPVLSISENQIENSVPVNSSLLSNLSSSSTSITTKATTTQTGVKKLNIKAYHERALQRKLKEQEKIKNLEANPSKLTQDLLILSPKNKSPTIDDRSKCVDIQSKTTEINTTIISDQLKSMTSTSTASTITNSPTKKLKRAQSIVTNSNITQENNINDNTSTVCENCDDTIGQSTSSTTNCIADNVKVVDKKFINIKSEGGKELKLKEKVKNRPQKISIPVATIPTDNINIKEIENIPSIACNKRKSSSPSIETNENIKDTIKIVDNTNIIIDNSLTCENISTNDVKNNFEDNKPSDNIDTDALNTVQSESIIEVNEPLLHINDVVMTNIKLTEDINTIKNLEQINCQNISYNQSVSMNDKLNSAEYQSDTSTFSHYFKLTKNLISDGLPDIVAQEMMTFHISTKTPIIIQNENIMEVNDINEISSKSKCQDDNKILTTNELSEIDVKTISSPVTECISINNDKLDEYSQNIDDLLEVMVPPDIVSDLLKDDFDDEQLPSSISIKSDKTELSQQSIAAMKMEFISSEATTILRKHVSTDSLISADLSNADTTISNTYDYLQIECKKATGYDELTLDDLSDMSMDTLSKSDHKTLSELSVVEIDPLSNAQCNMDAINLLTNDPLLMINGEDDKLRNIKGKINLDDIITDKSSIIHSINEFQSPLSIETSISDNALPSNDSYKEYSQQQIIIHDHTLPIEQPCDTFLDDPIIFSTTKSTILEPIECETLNNDAVEPIFDNQLEESSANNSLPDIILANDDMSVDDSEVVNSYVQSSFNNSNSSHQPSTSSCNDSIINSNLIPDKEIIKTIVTTSTEGLSSKSNDDVNNDDNNVINIDINDKTLKVDEINNSDCKLNDKMTGNNDETITKQCEISDNTECDKNIILTCDDSHTNKLLNNSNRSIIESTTVENVQTNLSRHNESARSLSETRTVEHDKIQCEMFNSNNLNSDINHIKYDRDHDSSRKNSRSKSSTPTPIHKKHKKHNHNHNRKKHKLTLDNIHEAISANIANLVPKPTTKDAVMSRMQEIDIAIQQLMNEKMTLYQMLQTDKWPVNQSDDSLNDVTKFKSKSHSPSRKSDKSSIDKESRVIMSRLSNNTDVERSTLNDISITKSQNSNNSKLETSRIHKTVVKRNGHDSNSKKLHDNSSSISKKRKYHHDEKESNRNKNEIIKDVSSTVKKRLSTGESSRKKNKSPRRNRNSESEHCKKPVKLSQMLAREFKPKAHNKKHKSDSPTDDDDDNVKFHPDKQQDNACFNSDDIIKSSLTNHELSDHENSTDITPSNTTPQNDQSKFVYTDESSWDTTDHSSDKIERSTGLSLLEQSIKREITVKNIKSNEVKKKSSLKSLQEMSLLPLDSELEPNLSSELELRRKERRKKHQQIISNQSSTKINNHVLEIIDAVAKNCVDDLYINDESPKKLYKKPKKNNKQSDIDKINSKTDSNAIVKDETSMRKISNQSLLINEAAQIKVTMNTSRITPSISPQSVSQCSNEYNSDNCHHDENEWTTIDTVGYIDDKNETRLGQRDNPLKNNEKEANKVKDIKNCDDNVMQSTSFIVEQDIVNDNNSMDIISSKNNIEIEDDKSHEQSDNVQKNILNDWQDSPNLSDNESNYSRNNNDNNESIAATKFNRIISDTGNKNYTLPVTQKSVIIDSTAVISMQPNKLITLDEKKLVNDYNSKKNVIKDIINDEMYLKERNDKSKRSISVVKDIDRFKLGVKEFEKSKSTIKEIDRSKSTIKQRDRPKSTVKELERSKSIVKEPDRPKSTTAELDRSKSTVKESERIKSTIKKSDDIDSSHDNDDYHDDGDDHDDDADDDDADDDDDNDDDDDDDVDDNDGGDEIINRRHGRSTKRKKQSSNRKTTSRSKSHSKRTNKSPSSRDISIPDDEQKLRPHSSSSSSSINSRRKSNITPTDTKTIDKNNSVRRGRKRKNHIERTFEEMTNCKVRLVDCKHLYLYSDSRSDILQRLGISRINAWTIAPSIRKETITPERSTIKLSSSIIDEDKNRSDDDSMEIIRVDDNLYQQNITSPESNADIVIDNSLSITSYASPQLNLSCQDYDCTVITNNEKENKNKEDAGTSSDYVEVLETRVSTPVDNSSSCQNIDDLKEKIMQYTVHKGPILDIKVFGDSFLAASEDGAIYRYCQRSNGILNIYKGHDAAVTCLYVHEVPGTADSGNTRWNLFSGSLDATLRCYDVMNGSLDRHIADVGSPIQCMDQAWGMIFVGTKSGHISRYDIKSGCLREDNLDFSDKPVLALRASTEGVRRVLIVASRNQPITIRDAQNGLYLRTISGQRTHTVYSLMRDRNLVYCGTSNTSIPVFDFISGEQVIQYTAGVGIVCMRLYRQLLFAGCYDGNIYIFDTKDNRLVCSIPGPGNMLLSMEIVDDKIIAGSKDRRLHAWQMPIQAREILAERA